MNKETQSMTYLLWFASTEITTYIPNYLSNPDYKVLLNCLLHMLCLDMENCTLLNWSTLYKRDYFLLAENCKKEFVIEEPFCILDCVLFSIGYMHVWLSLINSRNCVEQISLRSGQQILCTWLLLYSLANPFSCLSITTINCLLWWFHSHVKMICLSG